jgi:4-amino-4-deoxy-L-arabinose transferase-like glycosyltransferase
MLIFPLTDTTEARYAEVARIMMETGDWITPYFDYNIPFWGKPPLSFWLQAIAFKLFGVNEFAPRLPSLIATLLTTGLIFYFLTSVADKRTGLWASLIYCSIALVYMLSGVVITDPLLALGTTLSMVSFVMVLKHKAAYWGYLFFVGISIGLLSKGPIALVLIGGSISLWLLLSPKRWRLLKLFPWVSGLLLMAVLTLPWYIAAEIKTPGFLEYFILGEHFYRFIFPDWKGDLYGSAHDKPKGTIWLLWFQASFPWGILGLLVILKKLFKQPSRNVLWQTLTKDDISLYVIWAVFPMLFFTLSGNILWTYILPGLSPLAVLLALYLNYSPKNLSVKYSRLFYFTVLVVPLSLTAFTFLVYKNDNIIRTEKYLIEFYESVATAEEPLVFIDERSFSARYYSRGKAQLIPWNKDQELLQKQQLSGKKGVSYYLAVPEDLVSRMKKKNRLPAEKLYSNKRYELYKIE